MSSTHATPSSFITSVVRATSTPTVTFVPNAPPVANAYSVRSGGFTPAAIIGIVAAIVLLLLCVPIIAILLRRYERKRLVETVKGSGRSNSSLKDSVMEGQSLRNILVTRELQRSSYKIADGLRTPERAHMSERGWNEIEVRGGGMK